MQPPAERRVGDLVVVLEVRDETGVWQIERRCSSPLLLPRVILPLIEEAVPCDRPQLARAPEIVAEVRVLAPGERDARGVVRVVVPERVDPPAAPALGREMGCTLPLVLLAALILSNRAATAVGPTVSTPGTASSTTEILSSLHEITAVYRVSLL